MTRGLRFASRADAIAQLRARLERGGWPRAQMLLLVLLTGASGFLASAVLLAVGFAPMGPRYLLACLVAYACFLALLGIWIRWRRDGGDVSDLDPGLDLADFGEGLPSWRGGGGRSGGGGASAQFEAPDAPFASALRTPSAGKGSAGFDFDLDADAAAVPLLLALLVLGLVLSSLFVVWTAPALFAELLLDGVLAAALYRRLRHLERRHWLDTAVRKTIWPFVATALVLALVGFGLQSAVPQADSIGDVLPLPERQAH